MKSVKVELFGAAIGLAGFSILWVSVNKWAVIALVLCMWGNNVQEGNRK